MLVLFFIFILHTPFLFFFFFSSRRRHTRCSRDWSSDVCSSDLDPLRFVLRLEQAAVRVETRTVKDRVLGSKKLAELRLQLLVDALRAADEPHTGHAVTPFVERVPRPGDNRGMLRQAEIIVRAEVENRLAVRHTNARALRRD